MRPTLPFGRYLNQDLTVKCETISDLRNFLLGCRYVSDLDQFGRDDYWQPPEEFEKTKQGDCDDFALWAWRQLIAMGYSARFVLGRAGRYGEGHAWTTFERDGKTYLLEPLARRFGDKMPELSTVRYKPMFSAQYENGRLRFYEHEHLPFRPSIARLMPMVGAWLVFWIPIWLRVLFALPAVLGAKLFGISSPQRNRGA